MTTADRLTATSVPAVGAPIRSVNNDKILLSDAIKAVCTYVAQLWGCAKPSNLQIIERFRSTKLGALVNPLWYVANQTLSTDLGVPFVRDEIVRVSPLYQALFKIAVTSSPGFAPRQLNKQGRQMNRDISTDVHGRRVPFNNLSTCLVATLCTGGCK